MAMKTALLILLALILAAALWVRLAPSDPARWHAKPQMPEPGPGDWPEATGFRAQRIFEGNPPAVLAAFDAIARATPRTARIAGSPESGMVTYRTRSRVWGFPDYTTVAAEPAGTGTRLLVHGRLRFGGNDLGVNRARIEGWLRALTP